MTNVQPYTWDRNKPGARNGIRIFYGNGFLFLPWDEVIDTANKMVDAYESRNRA